jgi:hypothetical protein
MIVFINYYPQSISKSVLPQAFEKRHYAKAYRETWLLRGLWRTSSKNLAQAMNSHIRHEYQLHLKDPEIPPKKSQMNSKTSHSHSRKVPQGRPISRRQ